jgi:ribosomal protein S18 acetylase RimI-like enzyme
VDDAALLLERPEFLVFAGDGISDGRTRVAVEGDRVLGFATVTVVDGVADLEDLFVDPECHRRGIARRLIEDTVAILRATGHRALTVTGNPHALEFYRAVGFVEIGETGTALGPAPLLRKEL